MLVPALVAGLAGLLGGLVVPRLIAAVPEPAPEEEPATPVREGSIDDDSMHPDKEPYVDIAATPGLALRAAGVGALAGAGFGAALGWDWALLFCLVAVPFALALSVIDLRVHLLPSILCLWAAGAIAAAVLLAGLLAWEPGNLLRSLGGAVILFFVFFLMWRFRLVGGGDVDAAGLLGLVLGWFGWAALFWGAWLSFFLGAIGGTISKLVTKRKYYPHGPFMFLGAWVMVVFREPLLGFLGYL